MKDQRKGQSHRSGRDLGQGALDKLGQRRRVGADQGLGGRAVLVVEERGHGADAKLLGQLGDVVDVELGEEDVLKLVLLGQLLKDRSDHLAGTAPDGSGIDDDGLVGLDGGLEIGLGLELGDSHVGGCGVEETGGRDCRSECGTRTNGLRELLEESARRHGEGGEEEKCGGGEKRAVMII